MNMAKDLYEIVGQVIGRSTRTTLSMNSNFYELGGNSLNSIYTVAQLRTRGYFIGITDFITAKTLQIILNKLSVGVKANETTNDENKMQLKATGLALQHKSEVIE